MILVAFGANLDSEIGSPEYTYAQLPFILPEYGVQVLEQSPLYETAPVPISDQPNYFNGAMRVAFQGGAKECLLALMRAEYALGRRRGAQNAARGIDLDLLCFDDQILHDEALILPHPRMCERMFVLQPLNDIASNYMHPVFKRSIYDLYMDLNLQERRA